MSEFIATTSAGWAPTSRANLVGHQFVVVLPREVAGEVALDAEGGPPVELGRRRCAGPELRDGPERVADEIDPVGQLEPVAERCQGVGGVEFGGGGRPRRRPVRITSGHRRPSLPGWIAPQWGQVLASVIGVERVEQRREVLVDRLDLDLDPVDQAGAVRSRPTRSRRARPRAAGTRRPARSTPGRDAAASAERSAAGGRPRPSRIGMS